MSVCVMTNSNQTEFCVTNLSEAASVYEYTLPSTGSNTIQLPLSNITTFTIPDWAGYH